MKVEIIVFSISMMLIGLVIFVTHELNFIHEQLLEIMKTNLDMAISFDERLKKLESKKKKNKEEK